MTITSSVQAGFSSQEAIIPLAIKNFYTLKKELSYLSPHQDSYLNCPAYYLLTGRQGGFFVTNGENGMAICVHPNKSSEQILMPEIGSKSIGLLTKKALQNLCSRSLNPVLGKYSEDEARILSEEANLYVSRFVDPTMDWVFPIRTHSTEIVANLEGSKFVKVRNKVRAAKKAGVTVSFAKTVNPFEITSTATKWIAGRSSEGSVSDGYYETLTKLVASYPSEFCGMRAVDSNGELVGLLVWRTSRKATANVYAHLTSRHVNGLADLMLCRLAQFFAQTEVKFLNVGGSECENLDQYKKKFQPIQSLKQHSLTISGNDK